MKKENFKFKNNRNYIHGTDIFNFLIKKKNYKLIDIKFKKPLNFQPIITRSSKINDINACVSSSVIKNKRKIKTLIFNSNKKIKSKYVIDEDIPLNNIKLFKNEAKCNFITKKSPIEILVTLTKIFHLKKISKKKWLFTRIVLKSNFKQGLKRIFKISLDQNYGNTSTVCKIYENNKNIGLINFTVKQ